MLLVPALIVAGLVAGALACVIRRRGVGEIVLDLAEKRIQLPLVLVAGLLLGVAVGLNVDVGPTLYVAALSMLFIGFGAAVNTQFSGAWIVALGVGANLLVYMLNGGLPVEPDALTAAGLLDGATLDQIVLGSGRHLATESDSFAWLGAVIGVRALGEVITFGDLVTAVGAFNVAFRLLWPRHVPFWNPARVAAAQVPQPPAEGAPRAQPSAAQPPAEPLEPWFAESTPAQQPAPMPVHKPAPVYHQPAQPWVAPPAARAPSSQPAPAPEPPPAAVPFQRPVAQPEPAFAPPSAAAAQPPIQAAPPSGPPVQPELVAPVPTPQPQSVEGSTPAQAPAAAPAIAPQPVSAAPPSDRMAVGMMPTAALSLPPMDAGPVEAGLQPHGGVDSANKAPEPAAVSSRTPSAPPPPG